MIRQVARGIYDLLPLGLRAVRRVEHIVRDEMDRAGAQEILMPAVIPAELWQESGRWEHYGRELLRFKDRHERDFCFGPTHEEVVTDLIRREVRSYRDLPKNLYQIQVKFRDEVRPRFGLMRGREFIMKDAYSFHTDVADAQREYRVMYDAYTRIFERCGLTFRAVEAGTGAIGGVADARVPGAGGVGRGRHRLVRPLRLRGERREGGARRCCRRRWRRAARWSASRRPGKRTVEEVAAFLGLPPERFVKTLLYQTQGGAVVAVLVRGDHEVSETKIQAALGGDGVRWPTSGRWRRSPARRSGSRVRSGSTCACWPMRRSAACTGAVGGANRADEHVVNLDQARDFPACHVRRPAPGARR